MSLKNKKTTYCLSPVPITVEYIVEMVLPFSIKLLIRSIVKFLVERTVGDNVTDELSGIVKPAVILHYFPGRRSFITREVFVQVVVNHEAFPMEVTIHC